MLAGDLELVRDINQVPTSWDNAANLVNVAGTLYYSTWDAARGVELWKSDGTAAGTTLVKDINPGTGSSAPRDLTNVGGTLYFAADDGVSGLELWKSDGTEAGTVRVKDIQPAQYSSFAANLTNVEGTLYFRANDGVGGDELWRSDGTAAGTVRVKDIRVGSGSAFPSQLTNVNGTLFFAANDGVSGYELWKSDGTESGTVLVRDIRPGSNSSDPSALTNDRGLLRFVTAEVPSIATSTWQSDGTFDGTFTTIPSAQSDERKGVYIDGTRYFSSYESGSGWELWKSDGTTSGAVLVKDINPGSVSSDPRQFTNVGGTLYFTAFDGVSGVELWKSDGNTAGTVLVKDIWPEVVLDTPLSSSPRALTNVGGILYFVAYDREGGHDLWKSDGTAAGTVRVKDFPEGSGLPHLLTNVGGTLYFAAWGVVEGDLDLSKRDVWKSDGTAAGTVLVKDFGLRAVFGGPNWFTNVRGTLYFAFDGGVSGQELWKSDGTTSGTLLIKTFASVGVSAPSVAYLTNVGGTLYFSANDGESGYELWKSDGTESGTMLVRDIEPGWNSFFPSSLANVGGTLYFLERFGNEVWKSNGTAATTSRVSAADRIASARPDSEINIGGTLYFAANDGVSGYELWKSNDTAASTIRVRDIRPGADSASPSSLTDVGGTLYFIANDGVRGYELWKSDGTVAGTVPVRAHDRPSGSYPGDKTNVDGTLYFAANDGVSGRELWKSNGTAAGTVRVKDIHTGPGNASPSSLTNVGGTLYFTAHDGVNGYELWKSDGTEAGTVRVKEISPGPGSASPGSLTNLAGVLFFTANDGVSGYELWKSDGTEAGTIRVKNIQSTPFMAYPGNLMNLGGTLYFTAVGESGYELWKSDGTEAGTVRVKGVAARDLTNVGGTLYFAADDGDRSAELWKSDGTESGTVRVKDIIQGSYGVYPLPLFLTNVRGTLYFSVYDGVSGADLWTSDGTESGTLRVKEFTGPGLGSAFPAFLTEVAGKLYFTADGVSGDGFSATELWKSDGTEAGTVHVKDIRLGTDSEYLANVKGTLYFKGNDGVSGYELWKSDGTEAGTVPVRLPGNVPLLDPAGFTVAGSHLYVSGILPEVGRELFRLPLAEIDIVVTDATTQDFKQFKVSYEIKGGGVEEFQVAAFLSSDGVTPVGKPLGTPHPVVTSASQRTETGDKPHTITLTLTEAARVTREFPYIVIVADPRYDASGEIDNTNGQDAIVEADEENNQLFVIPLLGPGKKWAFDNNGKLYQPTEQEGSIVGGNGARVSRGTAFFEQWIAPNNIEEAWRLIGGTFAEDPLPYWNDDLTVNDGYLVHHAAKAPFLELTRLISQARADGRFPTDASLELTDSFDEEGDHANTSTHYEGRGLDLNAGNRGYDPAEERLAGLAILAGFDFIWYEKDHIHVSVRGQPAIPTIQGLIAALDWGHNSGPPLISDASLYGALRGMLTTAIEVQSGDPGRELNRQMFRLMGDFIDLVRLGTAMNQIDGGFAATAKTKDGLLVSNASRIRDQFKLFIPLAPLSVSPVVESASAHDPLGDSSASKSADGVVARSSFLAPPASVRTHAVPAGPPFAMSAEAVRPRWDLLAVAASVGDSGDPMGNVGPGVDALTSHVAEIDDAFADDDLLDGVVATVFGDDAVVSAPLRGLR